MALDGGGSLQHADGVMEHGQRPGGREAIRRRAAHAHDGEADLARLGARIAALRAGSSGPVRQPRDVAPRAPEDQRSERPWRRQAVGLLVMFVSTRVVLTVIGLLSRGLAAEPVLHPRPRGLDSSFSGLAFLDIWGEWDSSWYLSIAKFGYEAVPLEGPFPNYAFFPLYPLLARWVGWLGGGPFVGGLIVSNAALIVACVFLYRLVALDDDTATAGRAVKYVFAAPGAFLFSAMLTESIYLALAVMCFYFARTRRWWVVGVLGFLLALSRAPGVLVIIPLVWMYLGQRGFSLRRVRPDVLWLALLPAGLWVFMWAIEVLTGDALAFTSIQVTAWGHRLQDPLSSLWSAISSDSVTFRFNGWYTIAVLFLTLAFLRSLGAPYLLFVVICLLPAMSYGAWEAMVRYSVVAFPLYVVMARFAGSRPHLDQATTVALALLQGFLMSQWANNGPLVI